MKQLIRTIEIPLLVLKNENTGTPILEAVHEWEEEAWKASSADVLKITPRRLAA